MKTTQRLLALLLCLMLLVGLFPAAAFAEETEPVGAAASGDLSEPAAPVTGNGEPAGADASEEEAADDFAEAISESPAEAADDASPVTVRFLCTPEDLTLTVYPKSEEAPVGDGVLDVPEDPAPIEPEEDGTYLLLPGEYIYTAEAEGYGTAEDVAFTVEASEEPVEIPVVLEGMGSLLMHEEEEGDCVDAWVPPEKNSSIDLDSACRIAAGETWYWPIATNDSPTNAYKKITSSYGKRVSSSVNGVHYGVDIGIAKNTNVYAIQAGRVSNVEKSNSGAGGRYVIIKHDNGFYSKYLHLQEILVNVGDVVSLTTVIAKSGASGYGSDSYYGAHLHLTINYQGSSNSNSINPCPKGYTKIGDSFKRGYPMENYNDSEGKKYNDSNPRVSFLTAERFNSATPFLNISGETKPTGDHAQGKGFGLYGTINSYPKLTNVTVQVVYRSSGNVVSGFNYSINPDSTTYDIRNGGADSAIKFGNLAVGQYRYIVKATNPSVGTKTLVQSDFNIVGNTTKYTIDVNGYLDGTNQQAVTGWGTFDVWIDGKQVADDVSDFCQAYVSGTQYEITDIKPVNIHTYHGVREGAVEGMIGSSNISVRLNFRTNGKLDDLYGKRFFCYLYTGDKTRQLYNQSKHPELYGLENNVGAEPPSTDITHVWFFERINDSNQYRIISAYDAKSLDVDGASLDEGTNVQVWEPNDSSAQKWIIHEKNGKILLGSACTPYVLDCGHGSGDALSAYMGREYENDFQWLIIQTVKESDLPKVGYVSFSEDSATLKMSDSKDVSVSFSGNNIQKVDVVSGNTSVCTAEVTGVNWAGAYPSLCHASIKIKGIAPGTTTVSFRLLDPNGKAYYSKPVTVTVTGSYLDLNGYLDGKSVSHIEPYGVADVYINGNLNRQACTDYYVAWPSGTNYEIKIIKANSGYVYEGVASGSAPLKGTIGNSNSVVTLSFRTAKNYTISYDANGGTGAPGNQTKTEGVNLVLSSTAPKRTGYAFLGWAESKTATAAQYQPGGSFTKDSNTTLYAVWQPNQLNVIYNPNGATAIKLFGEAVSEETLLNYPQIKYYTDSVPDGLWDGDNSEWLYLERTGYEMATKSWNTKADGTGTSISWSQPFETANDLAKALGVDLSTGSKTVTVYMEWQPATYTVHYDANGGTGAPADQTKTKGEDLTLSSTKPSRANTSAGSYTVTLDPNGGSVSSSKLTANRTSSYSFKNWNTARNGGGTGYNPGGTYKNDADLTLYAQWNSNTTTAAVSLPTPTREGYSFKGWAESKTASSGRTGSYTPSGDVTLYAIWEKIPTYTVHYDANGGTGAPADQIKTKGVDLKLSEETPKRDSVTVNYTVTLDPQGGSVSKTELTAPFTRRYQFKNWNTNQQENGNAYNPADLYTTDADVTLYAQWRVGTDTTSITLPTPTRDNYTFINWNTNADGSGTSYTTSYTPFENVTLYAIWEKIPTYTVHYDANGGTGVPADQIKTKGEDLTLSSTKPSRANASAGSYTVTLDPNGGSVSSSKLTANRTTSYSFKNWNTARNGGGTGYNPGGTYKTDADATLYAQWNSNTTTAAVTLPTPTREGYSFKGWAESKTASSGRTGSYTPSGDVTLYAIWEQNQQPQPDPDGILTVAKVSGAPGTEILVPVSLDRNPGVAMIGFRINYDRAKLEYLGGEDGTLKSWEFGLEKGGAVWDNTQNETATGVIVQLKFRILKEASLGDTEISLTQIEAYNIREEDVILAGEAGAITITNRLAGDVNDDGTVNGKDLIRLRRYLAGGGEQINLSNADVNGDNTVNGKDLIRLRRYLAGSDVVLE